MPERTIRDLSRMQRLGLWWTVWRRKTYDAFVCWFTGKHRWEKMREYKTNRILPGWRHCARCWRMEQT